MDGLEEAIRYERMICLNSKAAVYPLAIDAQAQYAYWEGQADAFTWVLEKIDWLKRQEAK